MSGFFHSAFAWIVSAVPWLLSPASVAAPSGGAPAPASFKAIVPEHVPPGAPATRYANLAQRTCRAEAKKRKLAVQPAGAASGVAMPLRFAGPLQGVKFLAPGKKSVYGVFDCRLALALDDLASVLSRHGVVEVRIDNMYRPRARLPGKKKPSQHSYGLAVDIVAFKLADGRELVVEDEWRGQRGKAACGPEAHFVSTTDEALLLRTMVCDVARQGLFHHLLTPSYDEAHRDHLHFDIKRGAKELLVR